MSALKGHPKGLYLIFATSTAERFSYYGMRAIFILFLTQALLFDKEAAASIYGSYTGLVYLTPLIGGYIKCFCFHQLFQSEMHPVSPVIAWIGWNINSLFRHIRISPFPVY